MRERAARQGDRDATGPVESSIAPFLTRSAREFGKPVCRLGLAARGGTALTPADVVEALDRGVNFLNWPGEADAGADAPGGADAVSRAVASLGPRRDSVVVCVQFGARAAAEAAVELRSILTALGTDYVDVLTFYYVERKAEWEALAAPGGALDYCRAARRDGVVRKLGITSHQRHLAAEIARTGRLDALMIRYNAAHRGAEGEVFPTTDTLGLGLITYTSLRWGALLRPTPDDPRGFVVPSASWWYRFAVQSASVTVALMAPHDRAELDQDLKALDALGPLGPREYAHLIEHGDRVRRHAGRFP